MLPTPPILAALKAEKPLATAPDLPAPPPWRRFGADRLPTDPRFLHPAPPLTGDRAEIGSSYIHSDLEAEVVFAALVLRRPILLTGLPGTGKTSLAYWAAYKLALGEVLHWSITSRSTLKSGIYDYDAIGRLQAAQAPERRDRQMTPAELAREIGEYISLGPLGTALLPSPHPRVLVIDEIDKGDIDLPGDLLDVLDRGLFEIPELRRLPPLPDYDSVPVRPKDTTTAIGGAPGASPSPELVWLRRGEIRCCQFPLIFLTSNGEREFPPAFLRRCLRLEMSPPGEETLRRIVRERLKDHCRQPVREELLDALIQQYRQREGEGEPHARKVLSPDQLLNIFFLEHEHGETFEKIRDVLLKPLNEPDVAREAAVEKPPAKS